MCSPCLMKAAVEDPGRKGRARDPRSQPPWAGVALCAKGRRGVRAGQTPALGGRLPQSGRERGAGRRLGRPTFSSQAHQACRPHLSSARRGWASPPIRWDTGLLSGQRRRGLRAEAGHGDNRSGVCVPGLYRARHPSRSAPLGAAPRQLFAGQEGVDPRAVRGRTLCETQERTRACTKQCHSVVFHTLTDAPTNLLSVFKILRVCCFSQGAAFESCTCKTCKVTEGPSQSLPSSLPTSSRPSDSSEPRVSRTKAAIRGVSPCNLWSQ